MVLDELVYSTSIRLRVDDTLGSIRCLKDGKGMAGDALPAELLKPGGRAVAVRSKHNCSRGALAGGCVPELTPTLLSRGSDLANSAVVAAGIRPTPGTAGRSRLPLVKYSFQPNLTHGNPALPPHQSSSHFCNAFLFPFVPFLE